jgi:hypothetical protein
MFFYARYAVTANMKSKSRLAASDVDFAPVVEARRTAESAALLADDVPPGYPVR